MYRSHLPYLTLALCVVASPGLAADPSVDAEAAPYPVRTVPYQWRTDYHDATFTDLAKNTRLDWNKINAPEPPRNRTGGLVGAPVVEIRRNYIYVQDADGTITVPARSQQDLVGWFNFGVQQAYRTVPQDHKFIFLFTTFETGIGAFFYQHNANDVRGIGLPRFDNNGRSNPLEGFIFMNYYRFFSELYGRFGQQVVNGFSRHTFNQEAGHRWIVSFAMDRTVATPKLIDILGRMESHWSYYMDSGGSPMEGNWWRDNGNGTFTTRTNVDNWRYNPLDLYLMGLVGPSNVPDWYYIDNPVNGSARDISGRSPTNESPPQIFSPVTISGDRVDVDISEVTGAFGSRFPPAGQSPTRFKALVILLASQTTALSESQRVEFEADVDNYMVGFTEGTGGRAFFDYNQMPPTKTPIGGICSDFSNCDPAESTVCTSPSVGSPKICTRSCQNASTCPSSWCCQNDIGGQLVCVPEAMCSPPDAGMSLPPDSGQPMSTPDSGVPACTCDTTTACDPDCGHCDPECFRREDCTCDVTTICDPNCDHCDPECIFGTGGGGNGSLPRREGSSCQALGQPSDLMALSLLFAGVFVALRRRRS